VKVVDALLWQISVLFMLLSSYYLKVRNTFGNSIQMINKWNSQLLLLLARDIKI
jgi:hypothetical protein